MTIEVARIIGADERASHYRRSDRWHRLDLDGDGQDEWMVVYAIEGFGGGNNYAQYLTTFRYVEPVWFAFETHGVGGKGSLAVDGDVMSYISGQSLIFPAMAYDEDDPMCCPSVDVSVEVSIGIGGALQF